MFSQASLDREWLLSFLNRMRSWRSVSAALRPSWPFEPILPRIQNGTFQYEKMRMQRLRSGRSGFPSLVHGLWLSLSFY